MLKVILMTDDDPVDSWVAHQVAQQFPIAHSILLHNSADHSSQSVRQKLLKSPLRILSAIPRELISQQVESHRENVMAEQLWCGRPAHLAEVLPHVISIETAQINSRAIAEQLSQLSPDLVLVCGGPLLEKSVYSIPRLGSWNLQWGINDRYRGQHGIFFPLAQGNFDAIGATLHRIDSGINTGEALLQLRPELEPSDTESSIEIKIARAIVPQLVNLLRMLPADTSAGSLQGKAIDKHAGQTVLYRDRTAWLEIQYHLKQKLGLSSIPECQEKQTLFLSCPANATTT